MSYAPGPWKVVPYVDAIDIVDFYGASVAAVSDRNIGAPGVPPDNARLIAAAPDLLAACETLIAIDDGRSVLPGSSVIVAIRAAIRKATGAAL